ncbi:hypothetical protein D9757_006352 [Collybiopsis confluens]|uniref:Amino acid transporter transmembrane domain-containing protein n=1 Tax=Collybiopsis confluens TaxID=2823264 RepID=A0A8H5HH64_9AGAR|nr:hypothetical protein D9757_006352 [Collybiopsis confluens]
MAEQREKQSWEQDVFNEETPDSDIRYKTLSWQFVALLMISEIVSNGMLSLPSALAVIGIVPAVIIIVFLGIFALFTAKVLIDFKLNHPSVHSMGDAGYIIGGPVVREILSLGTVIFAIFATVIVVAFQSYVHLIDPSLWQQGGQLITGQQALATLSNNGLCNVILVLIFAVATFLSSLPRTLGNLSWLGLFSTSLIVLAGIVGMAGAGSSPVEGRVVSVTINSSFFDAFLAVTNPVFSYAGHFMFFILISEMRHPQDAMKAAWWLQGFSTVFYTIFAVVMYIYIGNSVASPAFLSLPPRWAKAAFAIALGNFLIATHTLLGWSIWIFLCLAGTAIAFVLAVALPIFSYLVGITASLFASWYTYGLAGFFWIHDTRHQKALFKRPIGLTLAVFTILAGAFICVAGTYVSIQLIIDAYEEGIVGSPFTC